MIWKCENVFQMWLRRLKWPSKVPGGLVWAWSQLLTLTRRWFGWLGKEGGTIGVAQKGHWWVQVEDLRDGQRIVGEGISNLKNDERGYLVVTHYQRLLEYVKPDYVHVFVDGNIVETGGKELSDKLEKEGYESYLWISSVI